MLALEWELIGEFAVLTLALVSELLLCSGFVSVVAVLKSEILGVGDVVAEIVR